MLQSCSILYACSYSVHEVPYLFIYYNALKSMCYCCLLQMQQLLVEYVRNDVNREVAVQEMLK